MIYTKQKLNLKALFTSGFAVLTMFLASFPLSVTPVYASIGPSWFPLEYRVAVADEQGTTKAFVIPQNQEGHPSLATIKTFKMDMTAYTSSVEECDDTPFTTADGSTTRDGIVATNILPFGTKVRIPAVFGDKIFEVHDRMNARYSYRMDVWMKEKPAMRTFGIKHNIQIDVVQWGDNTTQWNKAKVLVN